MGVALDLHELHHLDRSGETHAPQVVAPEVHEHEVLRTLLLIGQETFDQRRILLRGRATRARPRDGMHSASTFAHRHQRFRRRAHDVEVHALPIDTRNAQQVHVGTGIRDAQHAVDIESARRAVGVEPLRDDDLEGIPRSNELLGSSDALPELLR